MADDDRRTRLGLPKSLTSFDPRKVATRGGTISPAIDRSRRVSDANRTAEGNWLGVAMDDDLVVGEPIGEGGMGIVFAGTQKGLSREVAVKMPIGAAKSAAYHALIREARVTGSLEHPGIVPVHALGSDADGGPVMVMKRIEGVPWSTVLAEPTHARGPAEGKDPLQFHLEVLQSVTQAVAFAHSRGILHRDLKPENVMLGAFGEVYVLDWGLAVRTTDEGLSDIPLARDVKDVAGTPDYMAPEMAAPELGPPGPETDVYLLGALLFEVLCGRPPHQGHSMNERLIAAYESELSDFPMGTPTGLVEICRKAMARDRSHRYSSARRFGRALERYQQHRGSFELSAEAYRRLVKLARAIGSSQPDDGNIQELFAECRFGFAQALRQWDGNNEAANGLSNVLQLMAEYELDRGNLSGAQVLMNQSEFTAAHLEEKAAALAQSKATERQEIARLRSLAQESDPRVGHRFRVFGVVVTGLCWMVQNMVFGHLVRTEITLEPYGWYVVLAGLFIGANLLALRAMRRREEVSTAATGLLWTSLAFGTAILLHFVVGWVTRTPFAVALPQTLLMAGLTFLLASFGLDGRYRASAFIFLIGFLLAAVFQELAYEVVGIFGGVGAGILPFTAAASADKGP